MSHPPEVLKEVRRLASAYIQGEMTAEEVREAAKADGRMGRILASCMGVSTFPHELLEEAGIDPFTSEVEFESPLSITREGMERNLQAAMEGRLSAEALSDWVTDWFSWQIAARPDDEVVLELAGELMLGEEAAREVLGNPAACELFLWHLRNTPSELGAVASFGLAVLAHREELERLVIQLGLEELSEEAAAEILRNCFRETLESFPGLEDDFLEAARALENHRQETVARFLTEVAKSADPLSAMERR